MAKPCPVYLWTLKCILKNSNKIPVQLWWICGHPGADPAK